MPDAVITGVDAYGDQFGMRGRSVYLAGSEDAPAFAAMEIYGRLYNGALLVRKPTRDDLGAQFVVFNGAVPLKAGTFGRAVNQYQMVAKYESGIASGNRDAVGTKAGEWGLYRGHEGFLVIGPVLSDPDTLYVVLRNNRCRNSVPGGYYGYYPYRRGIRMPNGCSGCPCCPCVCWWATDWPNRVNKADFLQGPLTIPGDHWVLTSNDLTIHSTEEWYYLGDFASEPGFCSITGLNPIDDNGDIIDLTGDPTNPKHPRVNGTVTFTHSLTGNTLIFQIDHVFSMVIGWNCDEAELAVNVTWNGTTLTNVAVGGSEFGTWDGQTIITGNINEGGPGGHQTNYRPIPNDLVHDTGATDVDRCSFTIPDIFHAGSTPFVMQALYDPDCDEEE